MAIEIPLGRTGLTGLIDEADGPFVLAVNWYAHWTGSGWYVRREQGRRPNRVRIYLHRALTGWQQVDHIDGNGLNNQRSNLRPATQSQNIANIGKRSDSRQPFKGVGQLRPPHSRWYARIQGRGIGTFDTPEQAARAYDAAAIEIWGEYAQINFPEGR